MNDPDSPLTPAPLPTSPPAASGPPIPGSFPREHTISIRVRFQETDSQGHTHHTTLINWFEIGRIEMLRAAGCSYRELEESGILLVVTEVGCTYHFPTRYDDLIELTTRVVSTTGTRIRHEYEIRHAGKRCAAGFTVVAAVNRQGKPVRLPAWLRVADSRHRPTLT